MDIKIDKNIPLPKRENISYESSEDFITKMSIGDSIAITNPAVLTKFYLTAQRMRRSNGYALVKDNPKWKGGKYYATDYPKLISRTIKKDSKTYEVRLWRVK